MLDGDRDDAQQQTADDDGVRRGAVSPLSVAPDFLAALLSGGDSRLTIDPRSGLNRYFCPPLPAPGLLVASSCTASPIHRHGFERALDAFKAIAGETSPRLRRDRAEGYVRDIKAGLLGYFGVGDLGDVILCPSGTQALLKTITLIALERRDQPIISILPAACETGAGVPLVAAGRAFGGRDVGPAADRLVMTAEIPLRAMEGAPLPDDEVNEAYVSAAAAARSRGWHPVVVLTQGTKTGLIAPVEPPSGANVIVDACQARIAPAKVAAYLRRGWPVVVTGSKFFGGPASSGAVLFPRQRLSLIQWPPVAATPHVAVSQTGRPPDDGGNLGMVLRWIAALGTIEAFAPLADGLSGMLRETGETVVRLIGTNPSLVPIAGLREHGLGWAALPSIFTFAVRDPADRARFLSAAELQPLYEGLARDGVLLGSPISLGSFGGLRIAIGARDLLDGPADNGLSRLFDALGGATAQAVARVASDASHPASTRNMKS